MEQRRYRIVVRGRLSDRFTDAFGGTIVRHGRGVTAFEVELADQSMLHGVLARIGGLGLELVSVVELRDDGDAGGDR